MGGKKRQNSLEEKIISGWKKAPQMKKLCLKVEEKQATRNNWEICDDSYEKSREI